MTPQTSLLRRSAPLAALLFALILGEWTMAQEAHAAGFTYPENGTRAVGRGGAYMLGKIGPEALYFNPALLSRLRGHQVTVDLNLLDQDLTFQRAPIGEGDNQTTFDKIENDTDPFPCCGVFPAPMIFVSSDFGLENWTFAAGAYGPSAYGHAAFDPQGPQRYTLIESNIIEIYYSGAVSWHWEGLRIGATLQAAYLSTDITLAASGSPTPDGATNDFDIVTDLTLSDIQPTGILGVAYDVSPALSFGLSYKLPVQFKQEGTAKIHIVNPENVVLDILNPRLIHDKATFELEEADVIRASARYAHITQGKELFDLELTATYERWSRLKEFKTTISDLYTGAEGTEPLVQEIGTIITPKNWDDTFSIRLGGDVNVLDWLTLRAGAFHETAASPESTTHLDFVSFERTGGSVGATIFAGDLEIDLAYMYVQSPDRTVDNGEVELIAPLQLDSAEPVIVNNGEYTSSFQMFSLGLTYRFGAGPQGAFTPAL